MRIDGYDDLRPIGRGGFGVVYQGRDRRFARDVAVKVLTGVLDDTMTARFERECHAVGALSGHPHIVVVHDSGTTEEGLAYLVMELLAGGSLAERLAMSGPQSWPTAAELGVQLGGALETAHRGGVLHRDVKPENVLLSAYRQPKLVDFGIATVRGGFETKSASVSASLVHAAPEILAGKRSSTASDVYALGSTLFQVLTGRPAFVDPDDETLFPMLARIGSDPVPDLRPAGVPDEIAAVIERAMAKAPEDRYDSALAFALDLQQAAVANGQVVSSPIVVGHDATPQPAKPVVAGATTTHQTRTPVQQEPEPLQPETLRPEPERRPPRRRIIAVAATVVALLAAGGAVLLGGGDKQNTGASSPTIMAFAATSDATIRAQRTWSVGADDHVLSSDIAFTNLTSTPLTRTALEVIPKSVASDVSQVTFTPSGVTVVEADPVVRWQVRLGPRQVTHLRWTVPIEGAVDADRMRDLMAAQLAAERSLVPRLAAIAAAAGVPLASLVPLSALVPQPAASLATTPTPLATLPSTETTGPTLRPDPGVVPTLAPSPTPQRTVGPAPTTSPALKAPGVPRSVLSGYVQVVSYKFNDPNAEPSQVSVKVSWTAPAGGGAPSSYCVRWTGYAGSSPYASPSSVTCATTRTARITVPHVNPADSWLKWEVLARNKAGSSAWVSGVAVVPDLVGTRESDGVDKLRAAGLRVSFQAEEPDSTYSCQITEQSPRTGTRTLASYVSIKYKQCPP